MIAAVPMLFCFVLPALILPGGRLALWLALGLALIATFVLLAPAAAALSAIFPKSVDLNSIGNGSNAHQAATLLGMLAFVALGRAVGPAGVRRVAFLTGPSWRRCSSSPGARSRLRDLATLLFIPVRRLVASRCETLAQYY